MQIYYVFFSNFCSVIVIIISSRMEVDEGGGTLHLFNQLNLVLQFGVWLGMVGGA